MIHDSGWHKPVVAAAAILLVVSACTSATVETTTPATADSASVSSSTAAPETLAPPTTVATTTSTAESTTTTTVAPTTTAATTTTTTAPPTTTTAATTTSTSVPPPADNQPPTVEIVSPGNLSSHTAVYDANTQRFGAAVSLSALVSDPNGDPVTVQWISSDEGYLGSGESIIAVLHTGYYDSAQPRITARATDQWGVATEVSVQIIVWIPSDT